MEELGGAGGENIQDVKILRRERGSPAWESRMGICRVGNGGFDGGTGLHVLLDLGEELQCCGDRGEFGGGKGPLFWQDPAGGGKCVGRDLCGGERDPDDVGRVLCGGWDLELALASHQDHTTPPF